MKVGRNDLCPCGSGKKYKNCCINKLISEKNELSGEKVYQLQCRCIEEYTSNHSISALERMIRASEEWLMEPAIGGRHISGIPTNAGLAYLYLFQETLDRHYLQCAKAMNKRALISKSTNNLAKIRQLGIVLLLDEMDQVKRILEDIPENLGQYYLGELCRIIRRTVILLVQIDGFKHMEVINHLIENIRKKWGTRTQIKVFCLEYYTLFSGQAHKAYEIAQSLVHETSDNHQLAWLYHQLSQICCMRDINTPNESVLYCEKALQLIQKGSRPSEEKQLVFGIKLILAQALGKCQRYSEAEAYIIELMDGTPDQRVFYAYARLMVLSGRLDEALSNAFKAIFILEDDSNCQMVADIYFRMGRYEDAAVFFKKALSKINMSEIIFDYNDNGVEHKSFVSQRDYCKFVQDIYSGLIRSYVKLGNLGKAIGYLHIAEELYEESEQWKTIAQILPELEIKEDDISQLKTEIDQLKRREKKKDDMAREWAKKLIEAQDDAACMNIDDNFAWEEFENEIDRVVQSMKEIAIRDKKTYEITKESMCERYGNLDMTAREFLVTAETLFELHKDSTIDFAAIVVEYCKVLQKILRKQLGTVLPPQIHMLGEVISTISEYKLSPYVKYVSQMSQINMLRRKSAHTGILQRRDVDRIRKIYFEEDLIAKLVAIEH